MLNIEYALTSAKSGENLEHCFLNLTGRMLACRMETWPPDGGMSMIATPTNH